MEDWDFSGYDFGGDLSGMGGFDLNSFLSDTSWMNDSYSSPYNSTQSAQDWVSQFDPEALGYMRDDAGNWISPSSPSTGGSFLSGIGSTLGSLGSGLLNFLSSSTGKGLLGLGGAAASIAGGTPTQTMDINRTPIASPAGQSVFNLAQQQPLTMTPQAQSLYNQMDLGSLLNVFPAQTWQNAENMIPQTQAAREAALSSKLGRVAPNAYSKGPVVQNMISQVSQENDYMTQLATALQQAKAQAQQASNIAMPNQLSSALGMANYPQTYTQGNIANLANILQAVERGTGGFNKASTDQSLLSQLGGVLAALGGVKTA